MERSHSWSSAHACPAERDAASRQKAVNSNMFVVYILKSTKKSRHYIGHTDDINTRLENHNRGRVKSTKNGRPWQVIYIEKYPTRSDAYRRELEIKSYKGGILFKKLLDYIGEVA